MAYDQGYYQPPQRPYPAQRGPPPQQYPPQQYDQYPPDDRYDDGYNNGYAQDYNAGYQDMSGGARGNGGYPPQNHGYPPQQDYYGGGRSAMPPPSRGGQGRGYPNGHPGRGNRPAPLERSASSDPGTRVARKPLKTPPISPEVAAWDNPFPTFPGAKKKTAMSEEQKITQQLSSMDIGGVPQSRPKRAGSKNSQERYALGNSDDYGMPRPSMDSQRGRNYPPLGPSQQAYPEQRRGLPGPAPGYGAPSRQNGYAEPGHSDRGAYGVSPVSPIRDNFGPPSRSMTMPNEPPTGGRNQPLPVDERPYNGPIGRGMPPRPSTASGTRPSPQRAYPGQASGAQEYPQMDAYANGNSGRNAAQAGGYGSHRPNAPSITDFYDSYYDTANAGNSRRPQSTGSEMPNFDAVPANPGGHRRGNSIDEHLQAGPQRGNSFERQGQNGYQVKPLKSQPDYRAQAQPQAAVFDMAGGAPPVPNNYPQQGFDRYAQENNQYNTAPPQRGPAPAQGYGGYDDQGGRNGYQPPPRGDSAAHRIPPPVNGLPSGPKLGGLNSLSSGPSPQNGGMPGPRSNSFPKQTTPNADALPAHPPPVRAGLIPNTVANQANNKPPPVRNYNNVSPGVGPAASQTPAPPAGPPPVTAAELEQLKAKVKSNPSDQKTQLLLARKYVEASEVLVPAITDQRARNKAREKYIMDAHKLLKKLVSVQNAEAMFYMADCYGRGSLGLETDHKEAFSLYQSAAKAGHAAAAYRTAVCCELGNEEGGGTRKDPSKAIQWYKRAAMLGDTPAMYKMGMIQLKGLLGQPRNPREAVGWLKRAADRADAENPHALHELGLLYELPQNSDIGNSLVRDEAYSFSLFQQAADLGYKFSQFRLGTAYEYGLFNRAIDPRQSIMWYSRAAVQEEHQSELALSGWYLTGSEGVLQQSDTEAYLWARKAAMAGLAKAEYAMGYFTEVGIGTPANLDDAKRWYWRAAAQNFPKARERLEDLKKGGSKPALKSRERISRSKVGKQNEGECSVM